MAVLASQIAMPVHVKYNGRIIEIRLVGTIVASDLLSQLEEIVAVEDREPFAPSRFVDLREADTSEMKFDDVRAVAEGRRHEKLKNPIKSAFLAKNNVQYGLARTFQAINDNPQNSIRIFRDEAEARAWLAG